MAALEPDVFHDKKAERDLLALWSVDVPLTIENLANKTLSDHNQKLDLKNRVFLFSRYIVLTIICGLLLAGAVGRWFAGDNVGFYDVFHHFTNWSWDLLQLPFYSFIWAYETYHMLRCLFSQSYRDRTSYNHIVQWAVIFLMYTMILGVTSFVYVVVFTHTDAIAKLWIKHVASAEESLDVGELIIGNELYHSLPVIMIIIFTLVYLDKIRHTYAVVMGGANLVALCIFYTYLIYVAPIIPVLLYWVIFDPMSVYGINAPIAEGLAVLMLTLLVCVAWPIYFLTPMHMTGDEWRILAVWMKSLRTWPTSRTAAPNHWNFSYHEEIV